MTNTASQSKACQGLRETAHSARQVITEHREKSRKRFVIVLLLLGSGLVLSTLVATLIGRMPVPASAVVAALASALGLPLGGEAGDPVWEKVVVGIRLSRICLSGLVGMALATAGVAFQGILRNPLADPFTIGVSTGAAFGASLAIFFGLGSHTYLGMGLLPLASLAGALTALFTVIALARINGRLRPETMVLAGIVVATFLAALISLVKSLDEESVSSIVFWVMGSFQGRGWSHVLFALPYLVAGFVLVGLHSHELDLLSLGGSQAKQLGVDVERVRMRILIGASLLTAGAVAVSGVIGFVGLVVPHLVRISFGAEHRQLLILSGLLGALALLWSDVAARVVLPGGEELPVGVVTALLGGPFFCLLLKRRKYAAGLD